MNYIFRDGQLEISVKGLEFCLEEQNFIFGLELDSTIKFYQNMELSSYLTESGESMKKQMGMDT